MGTGLRRHAPLERVDQLFLMAPARGPDSRAGRPPDRATVDRVRAEFGEMRGLSLTPGQAARLFGLSRDDCERVLEMLWRDGFLQRDQDGRFRTRG